MDFRKKTSTGVKKIRVADLGGRHNKTPTWVKNYIELQSFELRPRKLLIELKIGRHLIGRKTQENFYRG